MTPQTTSTTDTSTYAFSPRELQRLAVYRAAIAAHFYTDECEPSASRMLRQPIVGRSTVMRRSAAHSPIA